MSTEIKKIGSLQGYLGALMALLLVALIFSYFALGELGINISLRTNTNLEGMAFYYTFDGTSVGTSTITDQSGSGRNTYFMGGRISTTSFAGATTTYTVPSGATGALVKIWGAGGGGGAGLTDGFGNGVGGEGGSGGYSQAILPVVGGENIIFESGKGGSGTGVRGGNGGGASTVKRGTTYLLIAGGGGGGGYGGAHCEYVEVDPPTTYYESTYGGYGGHGGGTSGTDGYGGYCAYDGFYSDGGNGGTSSAGGAGGTGNVGTDGTAGGANVGGNGGSGTCGSSATGCGGNSTTNGFGAGGGGGYYGGGGGEAGGNGSGGGGGGSGYLFGSNAVGYAGTAYTTPGNANDPERAQYAPTAGNGALGSNGTGAGSTGANGLIIFRAFGIEATSTVRVGRVGQGIDLNGAYEFLSIATSTDPLRNVSAATFATWFYVDNLGSTSQQVLLDISSGTATATPRMEVKLENPNPIILFGGASTTAHITVSAVAGDGESIQTASTTNNLIKAGAWNHVVTIIDYANDSLAVYVNGSLQSMNGTMSFSGTATSDTSPRVAELGRDAGSFVRYQFDGAMDDIRLYHRALSASDVSRLYHLGATTEVNKTILSPTDTIGGLMSHWTFDGAEMTTATATNRVAGGIDGFATSSVASYATSTFGSNSSTTMPVNMFYHRIFVKAWGGGGAHGGQGSAVGANNGAGGGFASTTISVTPGEVLSIYVGGAGSQGSPAGGFGGCCYGGSGGSNGGGTGGSGDSLTDKDSGDGGGGGGGGGYSGVLRGSTALMIAAGGGGSGGGGASAGQTAGAGGGGGGTTGTDGGDATGDATTGGGGGTSGSGGAAGTGGGSGTAGNSLLGGNGGQPSSGTGYGGGGGAGAGSASSVSGGGGGGGSSYIGGGSGGSTNSGSGVTAGNSSDGDRAGAGTGGTYASGGMMSGRLLMGYSYAKGPTIAIGRIGQALEFNGTDQLVKVGNVGSGVRTISFWMKADDTTVKQILNIDGTDIVELNSSSQVTATSFPGTTVVYVDGSSSSAVVATSTWHHVVITDTTGVNASTFEIGRAGSSYFDGMLDDVRLYNRVLTANEVQRLYHLGATTNVNTTIKTNTDLKQDLSGHWTFDGPTLYSNIGDTSGNAKDGRLVNFSSTTTVPGRIGQGMQLDGGNDYITSTTVYDSGDPVTLSAWILATSSISGTQIVAGLAAPGTASLDGQFLGISANQVYAETGQNGSMANALSTGVIRTNQWHHIVAVFASPTSRTAYLNGVAGSANTTSRVPIDEAARLVVGAYGDSSPSNFFGGNVDDVRVYNRALTAAEVDRLYRTGSPRGSLGMPLAFNPDSPFVRYVSELYRAPNDFLFAYRSRVALYEDEKRMRREFVSEYTGYIKAFVQGFTKVAEAADHSNEESSPRNACVAVVSTADRLILAVSLENRSRTQKSIRGKKFDVCN